MARIGIMIEGQEDLTWDRFFRLALAVEDLGFESLFRSDHLTALHGFPQRASLELWSSLAALALRTKRLRFGPLVCSMTFRHPAMVAKMAAAVDTLSSGRLDLGLGAGWHAGEHRMFGLPFPPYRTRLEMLDEGAHVVKTLWSGHPARYAGQHYRLEAAETHPSPLQKPPPLILGGKGEHTLRLVARHATEWNCSYVGPDAYRQKAERLNVACEAIGRDPATLAHSLMVPFVIAKDDDGLQSRIDAHRAMFPSLPPTLADWHAQGFPGGTPQQMVDQLKTLEAAGISRFMLQHNDLDDLASLVLLAGEVLPHVA